MEERIIIPSQKLARGTIYNASTIMSCHQKQIGRNSETYADKSACSDGVARGPQPQPQRRGAGGRLNLRAHGAVLA